MSITDHTYEWRRRPGRNRPCGAPVVTRTEGYPNPYTTDCGEPREAHKHQGLDLPVWPDAWPGLDVRVQRVDGNVRRGIVLAAPQESSGTPVVLVLLVTDRDAVGPDTTVRVDGASYTGKQATIPWLVVQEVTRGG